MTEKATRKEKIDKVIKYILDNRLEKPVIYKLHNKIYGKTDKRREYMRKWMANKRKQLKETKPELVEPDLKAIAPGIFVNTRSRK